MEEFIHIKNITDKQILEHFKRIEDIIPEDMNGIDKNPLIKYIKEQNEISVSMIEFFYHSDFLERLTPQILLISQKLYDKRVDIGWYQILLFIIEEKEDAESFCENILLFVEKNISHEVVREVIEKSRSANDMLSELSQYSFDEGKLQYSENLLLSESNDESESTLLIKIKEMQNEKIRISNELEKMILKYDQEKEKNILHIKELENEIKCLNKNIKIEKQQIHNVLVNRQLLHNRFIEEKRQIFKYKFQIEKMQKKITEFSVIEDKYKKSQEQVTQLKTENDQLKSEKDKLLTEVENLKIINNERADIIKSLSNNLMEKEKEIIIFQNKIQEYQTLSNIESSKNSNISYVETISDSEPINTFFEDRMIDTEKELSEEMTIERKYVNSNIVDLKNDLQIVKKKSNWFTNLIAQYSKKAFLKNSRQDQETMIFIKMMEMRYPADKIQKIKKSLSENIPCFELYKLICTEPTIEDLEMFFNKYEKVDSIFA